MAIRQRITGLRKAFAAFAGESESDSHPPFPADGLARRALKTALPKRGERRPRSAIRMERQFFCEPAITFQESAATVRVNRARSTRECRSRSTA
jgi:hypothetical protein